MAEEQKNKIPMNKSLQFYYNPLEPIRMLRYFPFQTTFNKAILPFNYDEIYKDKNINVGVLLYFAKTNSKKQLELQFYYLKKVNNIQNVLLFINKNVLDDEITKLIQKYNVECITQPNELFHMDGIGNLNVIDSIFQGLLWAKEKNIDILVKFDIELIAKYNWVNDFKNIAYITDGLTFSSVGDMQWNTFRTDGIGMNVKYWTNKTVIYSFQWLLQNECPIELNTWMHEISKVLAGINYSEKYLIYMKDNQVDYLRSGYVMWSDILGINTETMDRRHNDVLYKSYVKDQEYESEWNKLQS